MKRTSYHWRVPFSSLSTSSSFLSAAGGVVGVGASSSSSLFSLPGPPTPEESVDRPRDDLRVP